jgi:drug/metabolite transporter (DMT)-like permease
MDAPEPRLPDANAKAASSSRLVGIFLIVLTLACWTTIPLYLSHLKGIVDPTGTPNAEGNLPPLVDPWTANGWRYGFSTILWIPPLLFAWWSGKMPRGIWKAALLPSIFNAAAQVCFGIAPYFVSPGLMTFSLRLNIIFVTIGAAIFFIAERRIIKSTGFLIGITTLLVGTILTVLFQHGGLGGATGFGVLVSFGSALLYAAYALAVRKWMHGMPPLLAFAAVSQYTGLALVTLMLVLGNRGHDAAGVPDAIRGLNALRLPGGLFGVEFAMLLIFAVVGIGLGHTLYFHSIQRLGLAVSAGVVQLQPVTVSLGAIFVFPSDTKQHLSGPQWITGLVALTGACIMLYTQHRLASANAKPIDEFDDLPVDEGVAMVGQSNEPEQRS